MSRAFSADSGEGGQMGEQQGQRPGLAGRQTVFEGAGQETVEILPSLDLLSTQQREQGVVAGVGRDRVERQLSEGPTAPLPSDQEVRQSLERQRRDALLVITYRLSTYYALAIVALVLAVTVGWVVTASVGY